MAKAVSTLSGINLLRFGPKSGLGSKSGKLPVPGRSWDLFRVFGDKSASVEIVNHRDERDWFSFGCVVKFVDVVHFILLSGPRMSSYG
jgi:hypothetical protein